MLKPTYSKAAYPEKRFQYHGAMKACNIAFGMLDLEKLLEGNVQAR
jgi:hypothetical protein